MGEEVVGREVSIQPHLMAHANLVGEWVGGRVGSQVGGWVVQYSDGLSVGSPLGELEGSQVDG